MSVDFLLTEEQKMIRDSVRDFARGTLAGRAGAVDREGKFPRDLYHQMAELGLYGLLLPESSGGSASDLVSQGLVQEELARVSGTCANIQTAAQEVALTLHQHASEVVAQDYVPRILDGTLIPAFALTEPSAGSDAAGIRTRAVRNGDHFILSGSKQFVTFGAVADFCIVIAITADGSPKPEFSALLVELSSEMAGISIGNQEDLVGVRGTATAAINFEQVRVPAGHLIGELGDGLRLGLSQIDSGRISTAAMAVGIAQGALDATVAYTLQREQFGQPIAKFQAVQFKLAQMAMRIQAARLLYVAAALRKSAGENTIQASSEAKLFASDTAAWVTDEALQLFGGYGYVKDNPIERYWRDAKITQIYEGTSHIQHIIIARQLLKEAQNHV